jgi:hypothetical protein
LAQPSVTEEAVFKCQDKKVAAGAAQKSRRSTGGVRSKDGNLNWVRRTSPRLDENRPHARRLPLTAGQHSTECADSKQNFGGVPLFLHAGMSMGSCDRVPELTLLETPPMPAKARDATRQECLGIPTQTNDTCATLQERPTR